MSSNRAVFVAQVLIKTSPRYSPVQFPLIYSFVWANWRLRYPSTDSKYPLYSCPHFSLHMTIFPNKLFMNGLGLMTMGAPDDMIIMHYVINICSKNTRRLKIQTRYAINFFKSSSYWRTDVDQKNKRNYTYYSDREKNILLDK